MSVSIPPLLFIARGVANHCSPEMSWLCPKKEQFALILHFNVLTLELDNENANIGAFRSLGASGFSGSVQCMGSFQICFQSKNKAQPF